MERTSVFDTIKFRPGFGFFCFEQITVFQYFRDNSSINDLELPLFFPRMEIYWFSVLGEEGLSQFHWTTFQNEAQIRFWNGIVRSHPSLSKLWRPAWTCSNIMRREFLL